MATERYKVELVDARGKRLYLPGDQIRHLDLDAGEASEAALLLLLLQLRRLHVAAGCSPAPDSALRLSGRGGTQDWRPVE